MLSKYTDRFVQNEMLHFGHISILSALHYVHRHHILKHSGALHPVGIDVAFGAMVPW